MKKVKEKIVIGLVGPGGSGKDTVAAQIKKKYGGEEFRFSYFLIETLKFFNLEVSRENSSWLASTMRKKFGREVLTKALDKKINELSQKSIVVINGIRLPADYRFLRSFKNSWLISLEVPIRTRWQRVRKRKEKTDDSVSFKEFEKQNAGPNEKYIPQISKKADFVIRNDGGMKKLAHEVDGVMEKILNRK